MKDYEVLRIPNEGSSHAGMICLIVSTNRVGLYMSVLEALGKPEGIMIYRGINHNEGKLIIEAADDVNKAGAIPINYDRKRISFYNREFLGICKGMIREYVGGEFTRGIFYTVKGVPEGDDMILFDFHRAMYRTVKVATKKNARTARKAMSKNKRKEAGKNNHPTERDVTTETGDGGRTTEALSQCRTFNTPMGFSMPSAGNRTY